ncbi:glycosyltransferase family 9 protein [Tenggerimyces flavus]|uniref:Glycosyltransferase n=1 Tax=Tenggerimyces flavus TaxID=1708749 RepID=A0ABV7YN66_9ACTN|nr:hypothetical protein [Tenggerimyces flavus]MBM7790393.1 hypothetical protein [Tenggerimyces flavus]
MTSLLVNFVYAHNVGHAIEALHLAYGHHRRDPSLEISVALNAATPVELASLCPFVEAVYPVRLDLFDPSVPFVAELPEAFDLVSEDGRASQPEQRALFPGIAAYYDVCRARIGVTAAAPYSPGEHFRLALSPTVRSDSPRIAVLPGGSADRSLYPSVASWELILRTLAARIPTATFVFLGKLGDDGRTRTTYSAAEIARLQECVPSESALDLPLIDQLTVVASCDVFVSPHSGFGMAALAAGTPWLSLSGNAWHEYYFNGVPFYSVLPDVDRFPAYTALSALPDPVEDDGPRSPSMCAERIRADLDELVEAAAKLIDRSWPYETALAHYAQGMLRIRKGDASQVWSWDHVLAPYLTP